MARFYVSSYEVFESQVRSIAFEAELDDNDRMREVCRAVLWFIATGREFTGLHRACSHMPRGTVRAMLRRVERGMMLRALATRGSDSHVVTGDLDNSVLAAALGFRTIEAAARATCDHPYGKAYTLGKA